MAETGAPGRLDLVRAFINTTELGEYDDFDDPNRVLAWLEDAGLLEGAPMGSAGAARASAMRVREALRAVAAGNHGAPVDSAALEALNEAAAEAGMALQFTDAGAELRPSAAGVAGALGRLLAIVADAMRDGTWTRFKVCQNDECMWAFYDHARNRSAKWCDMAGCGNRMKARAYRARLTDDKL